MLREDTRMRFASWSTDQLGMLDSIVVPRRVLVVTTMSKISALSWTSGHFGIGMATYLCPDWWLWYWSAKPSRPFMLRGAQACDESENFREFARGNGVPTRSRWWARDIT